MAFTTADLATGNQLKAQLDAINDAQVKTALTGAKLRIVVVDSTGATTLTVDKLKTALGATAYDTQCSTALTALNTALGTAETTAQAAFDALEDA